SIGVARRRLDLQVLDLTVGVPRLAANVDHRAAGQPVEDRQVDVEANAAIEAQTLVAPALGRERDAKIHRPAFGADRNRLALPDDRSAGRGKAPEQALHEFA